MAKVEWIKLYTDMFNNKKITYIRGLPDGNNILLIWIMLLTMAGNCNNRGFIYLTENIPYTPELIAKELNFEINTVRLALETFRKLNMISFENELIYICGWAEHQNVDGMEKIRIQTKERVARYREKQKLLLENNNACNVTCNATVTESNGTEKKENKKKNKKEEREKEIKDIVDYLNSTCNTSFRTSTKSTVQIINARFDDGFTTNQLKAIIMVKAKEWLNNKEFSKYLRPSTLFTPKHAEDYFNQAIREGVYKDGSGVLGEVQPKIERKDDVERALEKSGRQSKDLREDREIDF